MKLQKFANLDLTIGIIDNIFMSMGSFFEFYFRHQNLIIESLLILVVVITLYVGFRALFSSGGENVGGDLGQLEETLKKLLEQKTESGADPAVLAQAQAAQEQLKAQVEQLKKELVEKEARLNDSTANAGAGLDVDERKKLDGQIKELQNKLAEYEIISEDIADLSHFKEENVRLKKELEAARQGGGPAPAATSVPTPVAESIVPQTETASGGVAPTAAAPAPAAPEPAPTPASGDIIDDDIMAEFARAVEAQKKSSAETPSSASVTESVAMADLPSEPSPIVAEVRTENVPIEEAPAPAPVPAPTSAAATQESTERDSAVMGQMDIDKMMSEADAIPEESEATLNALEAALDADKLLAEASEFEGPHAEEEKLMGDFEEFVKKEGTNS